MAAAAVPPVVAGGRCPYLAQFQFTTQNRMAPPMTAPQMAVPHFQLTPARIPTATRPMGPAVPNLNPGLGMGPRSATPALNLHIPTFNANLNTHTTTTWNSQTLNKTGVAHFPTLQWNTHSLTLHIPSWANTHGFGVGHPGMSWSPLTLYAHVPSLGFSTTHWTTSQTTHVPQHDTRLNVGLTAGNVKLTIPSLGFDRRPPAGVPTGPVAVGPKGAGPKIAVPNAPGLGEKFAPVKLAQGIPTSEMVGKVRIVCGSCHNCKHTPKTTEPNQVVAFPQVPVTRPVLPAIAPAPVVARQVPVPASQPPVIRQPVNKLALVSFPQSLPMYVAPPTLSQGQPATSQLLLFAAAPVLQPAPGKALLAPPSPTSTASMLTTDFFGVPSSGSEATKVAPSLIGAQSSPLGPTVEQPETTKLEVQLPTLAELIVPIQADRPAAPPVAQPPQGPSLITLLLQAPVLPSGEQVTPRELSQPALDHPPVYPSLVESLSQPPELPAAPGA
jgi:hypothetical protein